MSHRFSVFQDYRSHKLQFFSNVPSLFILLTKCPNSISIPNSDVLVKFAQHIHSYLTDTVFLKHQAHSSDRSLEVALLNVWRSRLHQWKPLIF